MQTDKDQWVDIQDRQERRRVQNMLAQRKYRRRKAEALRAAVASEDAQDPSPGHPSPLTMDGPEGRRSQEGPVISAAGTKEGPADPVASWNSLMAQLFNLPEPSTSSQHCPTGHAQLAPSTLLPLGDQYNCGSTSNFEYQAPQSGPSGTQADAGHQGEIDLSVSNFAGQFPGNVDLEYQIQVLGGGNSRYS